MAAFTAIFCRSHNCTDHPEVLWIVFGAVVAVMLIGAIAFWRLAR